MRPEGPGTIWVSYRALGKDDPMLGDLDETEMAAEGPSVFIR